jgi:hypothetical protein
VIILFPHREVEEEADRYKREECERWRVRLSQEKEAAQREAEVLSQRLEVELNKQAQQAQVITIAQDI